ncbi:IS66 family transposase [Vibrio mediterranei]|uniref:IS66 family transposase n=1 Tax=Vibrio mediterranei TaxID=689 RepID=UPI003CE56AD0
MSSKDKPRWFNKRRCQRPCARKVSLHQVLLLRCSDAVPVRTSPDSSRLIARELEYYAERHTIVDWMVQASTVLELAWVHLRQHMLKSSWLHADETPVKVIDSDKSKKYMWVYFSGSD